MFALIDTGRLKANRCNTWRR